MGAGVTTSPKPIIDLNGYPDVPQVGDELETNALVVGIFFDPLAIDCLSIKAQAVFFEDIGANFLEDTGEPCNIIRPVSEKIYIPCGAMPFLRPEIEKERSLQHEGLSVFRAAKPKQTRSIPYFVNTKPKSSLRRPARSRRRWRTEADMFLLM